MREHALSEFATSIERVEAAIAGCDYAFVNLMLASDLAHVSCGAVSQSPLSALILNCC